MNAFTALFLGVGPILLFAWVGSHIRRGTDERRDAECWLFYLFGAITVLIASLIVSVLASGTPTPAIFFLFLPSLWGALAASLLQVFSRDRAWPRTHLTWVLLGLVLVLFLGLWLVGDPSMAPIILVGGALLALVWRAWSWASRWTVAAYLVLVLMLLVALWNTDRARPLFENPAWLASIVQTVLALLPGAAMIVAARLLQAGFGNEGALDGRRLALALVSSVMILLILGYQVMLASIWDVATDGLSGIFLVGLNSLAGIASALLLVWKLTGPRKTAAILFAAIVPVVMIGAERLGTLDSEGKWGTLPKMVTQARAEKIDQAINQFHEEQGIYPKTLQELTPKYLLFIPVPYMIRGQDWCYEGGDNYYRLGYVYREIFSLPAAVRVHASRGQPPDPAWECDQEAAKYQDVPGF